MDFSRVPLTPAQEHFAADVRAFLDELITPAVHDHQRRTGDGFHEGVHLALGARGWLYPSWPVADGGAGLDAVCCDILEHEIDAHRIPMITHGTTRLVWNAVSRFAPPDLVSTLRPEVAAGRVRFCLGYTDPEGGSDIAAAHLRAVPDGDSWLLDGAKMFTTGAQNCQYTFLLTRTDPSRPKHRGLTMFLVPLDSPGVTIQPIRTYGGERTNAVYFTEVRVSDHLRLGPVNEGWATLRGPLDAEHGSGGHGPNRPGHGYEYAQQLDRVIDTVGRWALRTGRADDPAFRDRFGRWIVECEAALATPATLIRIAGSTALIDGAADLIDLMGPEALLTHGTDGAIDDGELDFAHRFAQGTATYGGTLEIFRTIIAHQILGLPRPTFPGSRDLVR
jgi:3-oxocholest-4-en-26-oyl-CoA dehydrogenase alpha subunit